MQSATLGPARGANLLAGAKSIAGMINSISRVRVVRVRLERRALHLPGSDSHDHTPPTISNQTRPPFVGVPMRFALFRFLSIVLLSVAVLSGCRSTGSEFLGTWVSRANPGDSFEIVRNGREYLIVSQGRKIGAILDCLHHPDLRTADGSDAARRDVLHSVPEDRFPLMVKTLCAYSRRDRRVHSHVTRNSQSHSG